MHRRHLLYKASIYDQTEFHEDLTNKWHDDNEWTIMINRFTILCDLQGLPTLYTFSMFFLCYIPVPKHTIVSSPTWSMLFVSRISFFLEESSESRRTSKSDLR